MILLLILGIILIIVGALSMVYCCMVWGFTTRANPLKSGAPAPGGVTLLIGMAVTIFAAYQI